MFRDGNIDFIRDFHFEHRYTRALPALQSEPGANPSPAAAVSCSPEGKATTTGIRVEIAGVPNTERLLRPAINDVDGR
jgi:hypothetical protein